MIAVVWEDANNCINSIINVLNSKFPKEAVYYLSKRPETAEIEKLTRPPFVFSGWLIYANKNTATKVLQQLEESRAKNIIVIRVTNRDDYKDTVSKLSSYNVKVFDNHELSKEQILKWIETELGTSEDIAKYLYNRVGGYLKEIIFAVQTIKRSDDFRNNVEITRKLMRTYVEKNKSASIMDLTEYMLGISGDRVSSEDVFRTLYKFRYGESWILEAVIKELQNYIKVHTLVRDCSLDISNYTTQAALQKDKAVRELPLWKLKRIILNYGKVSMERLVTTLTLLNKVGKSHFDLIKIIQLVKIGGI